MSCGGFDALLGLVGVVALGMQVEISLEGRYVVLIERVAPVHFVGECGAHLGDFYAVSAGMVFFVGFDIGKIRVFLHENPVGVGKHVLTFIHVFSSQHFVDLEILLQHGYSALFHHFGPELFFSRAQCLTACFGKNAVGVGLEVPVEIGHASRAAGCFPHFLLLGNEFLFYFFNFRLWQSNALQVFDTDNSIL